MANQTSDAIATQFIRQGLTEQKQQKEINGKLLEATDFVKSVLDLRKRNAQETPVTWAGLEENANG